MVCSLDHNIPAIRLQLLSTSTSPMPVGLCLPCIRQWLPSASFRGVMKCASLVAAAPASHPGGLAGYAVDSSTIALSWMVIPPTDKNGIIQYYSIELTENNTGLVYVYNSSLEDRVITGLHPYYIYECTVAAVTILTGPFSPPVTIQTKEDGQLLSPVIGV